MSRHPVQVVLMSVFFICIFSVSLGWIESYHWNNKNHWPDMGGGSGTCHRHQSGYKGKLKSFIKDTHKIPQEKYYFFHHQRKKWATKARGRSKVQTLINYLKRLRIEHCRQLKRRKKIKRRNWRRRKRVLLLRRRLKRRKRNLEKRIKGNHSNFSILVITQINYNIDSHVTM